MGTRCSLGCAPGKGEGGRIGLNKKLNCHAGATKPQATSRDLGANVAQQQLMLGQNRWASPPPLHPVSRVRGPGEGVTSGEAALCS